MINIIISNYCKNNLIKPYGYIYRAISPSGKIYIGQTTKDLKFYINRAYKIRLKSKSKNYNRYFYRALRKYGFKNFKWHCLCECHSLDDLNFAETYYIVNFYKSINPKLGYNLNGGGNSLGIHSPILRRKNSEAIKKYLLTHKPAMLGKKHSKKSKNSMSKTKKFLFKNNLLTINNKVIFSDDELKMLKDMSQNKNTANEIIKAFKLKFNKILTHAVVYGNIKKLTT